MNNKNNWFTWTDFISVFFCTITSVWIGMSQGYLNQERTLIISFIIGILISLPVSHLLGLFADLSKFEAEMVLKEQENTIIINKLLKDYQSNKQQPVDNYDISALIGVDNHD